MQRFELCYVLPDSTENERGSPRSCFRLPGPSKQCLSKAQKPEPGLVLYRYDFMPKGIISRLTVRLHRFVRDPEMAWITGVLFQRRARERSSWKSCPRVATRSSCRREWPGMQTLLSIGGIRDRGAELVFSKPCVTEVKKLIPCNCLHMSAVHRSRGSLIKEESPASSKEHNHFEGRVNEELEQS